MPGITKAIAPIKIRTNVMKLTSSNERIFEAAKSKPLEGLRGLSPSPVRKMTDILETFVDMLLRVTTRG